MIYMIYNIQYQCFLVFLELKMTQEDSFGGVKNYGLYSHLAHQRYKSHSTADFFATVILDLAII